MICKPEQGLICALVSEEHEVDDGFIVGWRWCKTFLLVKNLHPTATLCSASSSTAEKESGAHWSGWKPILTSDSLHSHMSFEAVAAEETETVKQRWDRFFQWMYGLKKIMKSHTTFTIVLCLPGAHPSKRWIYCQFHSDLTEGQEVLKVLTLYKFHISGS